jgi:hypothetical protein
MLSLRDVFLPNRSVCLDGSLREMPSRRQVNIESAKLF